MPYLAQAIVDNAGVENYEHIDIFRCPSYPTDKKAAICYVINGWDPGNTEREIYQPTKLSSFKGRHASIIYIADSLDHLKESEVEQK